MAFQPNPNLFNSAFGGGLRSGSALADLMRNRRRESELERLAQGFAQNQDYNALGTGLMGIGMVGPGVNTMQVPYQREQDALTRAHQQAVFDANQAHRDRSFEAGQSYRAAQLANQRANIGLAQQRLAQASQPGLPDGYMWNDPNDRSAGVSMLPGYMPTKTPSGFRAVSGPDGEMRYEPIPGGPQDPEYITAISGAKKQQKYTNLPVNVQKQIAEADEVRVASQNTISTMREALGLNDSAYEGPAADSRGGFTALFGSDAGEATVELENLVKGGALENLKAIFGGMPTEGERQILIEVQGSVTQPAAVREKIFTRAIAAAMARENYNRRKAAAMRDGSYYDSGFDPAPENYTAYMPQAQQIAAEIKGEQRKAGANAPQASGVTGDPEIDALVNKYSD